MGKVTCPFQVTCVAGIVGISDHGAMKVYYLEDGSAGRLRAIWFHESEISRQLGEQQLEYVRIDVNRKAFHTDGVLKGRTSTCAWWGGWTRTIISLN